MSFIATAAIIGGGTYLAARESRKGQEAGFQQVPETKEAKEARKKLYKLATGEPPEVPLQKIAPLPAMGEERQLARDTAKDMIQQQDIFSLPEVQGIIQEATVRGNLLANRLGRMLQSAGSLTATTGRDVLGRATTDVQKNLAASLAPFAMEERTRRREMIPVLEGLGLTEEERRRITSQAELDALFQQEHEKSKQLETFTIPLLQSIIGLQPDVQPIVTGGQSSTITQMAPIIGPVLAAALQKSGGGGAMGFGQQASLPYYQGLSNQWQPFG